MNSDIDNGIIHEKPAKKPRVGRQVDHGVAEQMETIAARPDKPALKTPIILPPALCEVLFENGNIVKVSPEVAAIYQRRANQGRMPGIRRIQGLTHEDLEMAEARAEYHASLMRAH